MSGSYYSLLSKYNQLLALIQKNSAAAPDLTEVLTAGNDAGGQSITGLNDVALSTINGSVYPPVILPPDVADNNTNAVFYPTFVDGAGASKPVYADTTTLPISVNPSTGDFNVVDTLKITQTQVAVGKNAGETSQGVNAVACGRQAGQTSQGIGAVACGYLAGSDAQGVNAVACGNQAGQTSQGAGSVACGYLAGRTNQHANSIVINGTGLALNTLGTSRFIVKPIRDFGVETGFVALFYNPTTGELAYT